MESIDRLKKYVEANTDRTVLLTKYPEQYGVRCSTVINDLIDAVERDVEEGYVELPKDADGVTIVPSDNMVDRNGNQFVVSTIEMLASGEWLVYGNGKLGNELATKCRHHKPPTTEDVLLEFFEDYDSVRGCAPDENKVLADFAKRLQLLEEG